MQAFGPHGRREVRRLEAQRNELNSRVRLLREELQLLLEPGSYIGEVIKAMGKTKVLVKVRRYPRHNECMACVSSAEHPRTISETFRGALGDVQRLPKCRWSLAVTAGVLSLKSRCARSGRTGSSS